MYNSLAIRKPLMSQVLFVSHSKRGNRYYYDASTRYRCIFPAEFLNTAGITAHVVHVKDLKKIDLSGYTHLIAHRPQDSFRLRRYLKKADLLGIRCIVDFDDLLFRPDLAAESPSVLSGTMDLRTAQRENSAYLKALRRFRYCWVSTDRLKAHAEQAAPGIQVDVCYNQMSARWTALSTPVAASERMRNKVIRYMPGTAHHRQDFARIQKVLVNILETHPDIRLEVMGELEVDERAFPAGQFSRLPYVSYDELPEFIASSWLTIAPLEDTEFNRCKSGLKFWESGIFGVPVICSPLPDMERFANDGLIMASEPEAWPNVISQLCDAGTYEKCSADTREKALGAVITAATDIRASLLGRSLTPSERPALSAAQLQNQHIHMCAKFGPRWVADALNPTAKHHHPINALKPEELSQGCKDTASFRIKSDSHYKNRSTTRRKLRKLIRNPRLFFIDMLKNFSN
ncbi:hypothetical protein ACQUQU_09620 [Thalassolituus sp. LLYu03]|uniref:hypothetical protein n=1 Tax=Thalassolituus sp. LLYu03 TaxID=3421656 RepID=UPI003D2BBDC3